MTQPYAKSNVVDGKNTPIVVAKNKGYSIYSQVLRDLKKDPITEDKTTNAPSVTAIKITEVSVDN